jgi:putative acetyltransferase
LGTCTPSQLGLGADAVQHSSNGALKASSQLAQQCPSEQHSLGHLFAPRGASISAVYRLEPAGTDQDWREARALVEEYAASLEVDLAFQGFADEVATLATCYGPPEGVLLLAREEHGELAGCVAVHRLGEGGGEMKRLYVRPAHRGRGLGVELVTASVAAARTLGCTHLRLDTLPSMTAAIALYRSLGFRPIAPYRYNPVPGAAWFELDLR